MNIGVLGFPRVPRRLDPQQRVIRPTLMTTFPIIREDVNCSIRDFEGGIRITALGLNFNGNNLRYAIHPFTSGSNGWIATARFVKHSLHTSWAMHGIIERYSVSGASRLFSFGRDISAGFNVHNYSSDTGFAGVAGLGEYYDYDVWMRIRVNGGFRYMEYSRDGRAWQTLLVDTVASSYIPVSDQIGVYYNPNYGGSGSPAHTDGHIDLIHWQFTQL